MIEKMYEDYIGLIGITLLISLFILFFASNRYRKTKMKRDKIYEASATCINCKTVNYFNVPFGKPKIKVMEEIKCRNCQNPLLDYTGGMNG